MHYGYRIVFVIAAMMAVTLLTNVVGCASPVSSNALSSSSSVASKGPSNPAPKATLDTKIPAESKAATQPPLQTTTSPNVLPEAKISQSVPSAATDNQTPMLRVTEPEDELELETPEVRVAGKTVSGAVVSVDDIVTIADQQGSFAVTLRVGESPHAIEIVASDPDGNQVSEIRTVFLK